MEKDAKYLAAGLFVSLSLLALVIFVIWLAGIHRSGDYARYTIYFADPVSGLDKDGYVKYRGVTVGKILAMRLAPGSNDLIKVDIEIKASTPIHAETTAQVEMQGITGQRYVELTSEAGDRTPPRRVPDEEYPVLKGNASQFSKQFLETMSAINEVSKGTAKTMESIRALTDKLKEDPSQVLHPPTRKGVEIPK